MKNELKYINGRLFEDDALIIGKWVNIGFINGNELKNIENLKPPKGDFSTMYCLPNGEKYWIFEGWTKGFIYIHYGGEEPVLEYTYEICTIDKTNYMFLKILTDNDSYFEVFKKVNDTVYKLREIGRHDNINLDFVYDSSVVGIWKSVGYVNQIKDFKSEDENQKLYLEEIVFYPDGRAKQKYFDEDAWDDKWTKNHLINIHRETASRYQILKVNGKEYLFLEWKMGNYIYGEKEPSYYVFTRYK